ncbi:hypothetical protein AB205_0071990 [Aquarana catesbeiana]|uniref:tRNA pseudouridine(55) synthase n=1 Tax=Aquarana catesbeiana TaxID=8400 RepID=A0A2G9RST4_AQUCT|nr:hypothetical protein AB205_0071990 [Aquarana catesbeiana]
MAAIEKAARLLSLNGLFPVYKPKGPTSAQSLYELKMKLLNEAGVKEHRKKKKQTLKIGHGGTLDCTASGVLVVGIGEGTKMLGTMLGGSKKYTVIGELGKETDTLDASGTVTEEKPYDHITREDLEKTLKTFTGNIMQVPPLFSALKKDGKRLSCLVREGAKVEEKPARLVTVYGLSITDFQPPLFTLGKISITDIRIKTSCAALSARHRSCSFLTGVLHLNRKQSSVYIPGTQTAALLPCGW